MVDKHLLEVPKGGADEALGSDVGLIAVIETGSFYTASRNLGYACCDCQPQVAELESRWKPQSWRFATGDHTTVVPTIQTRLAVNTSEAAVVAAIAGVGLTG